MSPNRRPIRTPVRRPSADQNLLITLLVFTGTVALTRVFLGLTEYPQVGGGELHIAYLLWGGLLLFTAALLPLLFSNRWVYTMVSVLAGAGIGLFIDEVGKYITRSSDYFYPPAALWAGARTFRMGLLMYGKRPSLAQIWGALRKA